MLCGGWEVPCCKVPLDGTKFGKGVVPEPVKLDVDNGEVGSEVGLQTYKKLSPRVQSHLGTTYRDLTLVDCIVPL